MSNLPSKWEDAVKAFRDGAVSGFISNLLTVVINTVMTTWKRWVRIVREGVTSLYCALKMLAFPPEGMTLEQAAHEASKLLVAGAVVGLGVFGEERSWQSVGWRIRALRGADRGCVGSPDELKMRHHYKIRAYRVERGLSLRELAAMVGIGRMEMTKIDAGERLIDETLQATLAEALGVDPGELDYAVDHSGKR